MYSLQNNAYFEVRIVEDGTYPSKVWKVFSEDIWNGFLNKYSTNPISNGKRISGTDQVDKKALYNL